MNNDIFFIPLGGAQRVGASCYYLRLGKSNIILDAGIGFENGLVFEPNINSLLTSPFLESLNQIEQIFISHAHLDHVGYLLKLLKNMRGTSVYMTEMTRILSKYQLYDKNYILNNEIKKFESEKMAVENMLDEIINVTYMQKLKFNQYDVTFFPAGHIPGAMMTLFEYKNRRILYTGDYSLKTTSLTDGCIIPKNIDTVIMCGIHARNPKYKKKSNYIYKVIKEVFDVVIKEKKSVMCCINQLSKGIEFLSTLNELNDNSIPIYIDQSLMPIIESLEKKNIPILKKNNHIKRKIISKEPHIFLTSNNKVSKDNIYVKKKIDFSLHEDFFEMIEFIKKINPKTVVMVHVSSKDVESSIEEVLMSDCDCRTQFIFPKENEIYRL